MGDERHEVDVEVEVAELRASARGWHTVQMAALGFIGLCGALQGTGGEGGPRWLQILAGTLVLLALAVACVATLLVATVAWPLHPGQPHDGGGRSAARRVRRGIALTFVSVALLALGTSSSWWPSTGPADASGSVQVTTRRGAVCGTLLSGERGGLALDIGGQRAVVAFADVVALAPAEGCPG